MLSKSFKCLAINRLSFNAYLVHHPHSCRYHHLTQRMKFPFYSMVHIAFTIAYGLDGLINKFYGEWITSNWQILDHEMVQNNTHNNNKTKNEIKCEWYILCTDTLRINRIQWKYIESSIEYNVYLLNGNLYLSKSIEKIWEKLLRNKYFPFEILCFFIVSS